MERVSCDLSLAVIPTAWPSLQWLTVHLNYKPPRTPCFHGGKCTLVTWIFPPVPHAAKPGLGNKRALGRVSLSSVSVYGENELSLKLLLWGDSVISARKEVKTTFFHIWALALGSV